ncbi:hypothetical protein [Streptomyces cyaneofuscatus]|uniref:hypothetical protein n=1 Tax=Streptomyces cyaneofuscatus TaxID=66883 RepID=UPI0036624A8E
MAKPDDSVHYFWTKSEADTFKHKYNGLSTTVEYMKVALAGLSIGATVAKFDFTYLKVDEKGIVVGGVQKYTWPHARDDKGKAEAAEKKLVRLTERAERADDGAKDALEQMKRLRARMDSQAGSRVPIKGTWALETQLKQVQQQQLAAEKASKKAQAAYVETRRLALKAGREERDAEKAAADAASSYRSMRSGALSTRQNLRELEKQLAG